MSKLIAATALLVALSACHGLRLRHEPAPLGEYVQLEGPQPPVDLYRSWHLRSYRYRFVSERSPVDKPLRAVWVDDGMEPMTRELVIAVGDEGTILERTVEGPWKEVDSPADERRLNAVSGGVAVGEEGTILVREEDRWRRKPSGVTTPLYAVTAGRYRPWQPYPGAPWGFAAGANGVLLRRGDNGWWTQVPTGTEETFRSAWFCATCATPTLVLATESGSTVVCTFSKGRGETCAPGPPRSAEELPANRAERTDRRLTSVALLPMYGGIAEVILSSPVSQPEGRWSASYLDPWPPPAPARLLAAGVGSGWWWFADGRVKRESIAVGEVGAAVFLGEDGTPASAWMPTGGADLYGIDTSGDHIFAVGAKGVIVHGTVPEAVERNSSELL